ncbi:MAG: hypothetical protein WBQ79_02745 [Acidobacteriaceae bacterium]
MKRMAAVFVMFVSMSLAGHADTVILAKGASYSGQFTGTVVNFTDQQGIQYTFPRADVQTLVFNASADTVTLRNGKSYVGHFTGRSPVGFTGAEGIQYQFPVHDIESLVFNTAGQPAPAPEHAKVIPFGTDIVVRTDENIDSANTQTGQLYRGAITERVLDAAGGEAIPAGAPAQLLIRQVETGGATGSPELVLDLYSVTLDGKQYRVVTSNVDESNDKGLGRNSRTAKFLGGGAALGALMGGIFGGGRGAGIGALSGAGGGALTQIFTRGHVVKVPAESVLRFRLEHRLVLQAP